MSEFVLKSPSFVEGGSIPIKHSCDGQDVSPALVWEGAPAATAAFALIVDDPDANQVSWLGAAADTDVLAIMDRRGLQRWRCCSVPRSPPSRSFGPNASASTFAGRSTRSPLTPSISKRPSRKRAVDSSIRTSSAATSAAEWPCFRARRSCGSST